MPQGFSRLNGLDHIDGVAANSEAGAQWYLDKANKQLVMYPHADGTGDYLSVVPVGITKDGPIEEVNAGWRMPIVGTGSQYLYLVDFQLTKLAGMLDHVLFPGLGIVIGGIPAAEVPAIGNEWRPERVRFGGPLLATSSIHPQSGLHPDTGLPTVQEPGVVGSLSFNSMTKFGDDGGKHIYGYGKYAQGFALAVGWRNGQVTGWVFGRFENMGGGEYDKVFDITAQFQADMTRNAIGNPTTVSVSADLGYTTTPGSKAGLFTDTAARLNGGFNGVGDVTLDSVSYWGDTDATGLEVAGAVYDENATPAPVNVEGDTGNVTLGTITGKTLITIPAAGTPAMTLSPGTNHAMGVMVNTGGTIDLWYDQPSPSTAYRLTSPYNFTTEVWATSPTVQTTYDGTFQWGMYFSYTAATSPPTVNTVVASPSEVTAGTNISLIAGITDDDHTITEAEYYIGADPGEGSGTAMSLGAGTTSRTASATIDTTLLLGAYTVWVRGADATDGWGAANFDTFTVNAAPEGGGGGALGSSFKKFLQ